MKQNKKNPFFIYLSTNAPHGPFNVADKYKEMYAGNPNVPNAAFWGMITNIDENMGRLMKVLDEEGLADNTLLIFTTDNGTAAGSRKGKGFNAGMKGNKGSQYDGGHRVPFLMRWPAGGLTGGRDVAKLTAHIDILPTLTEICGLKHTPARKLDGMSIQPLLSGKADTWPARTLVVESQRIETPQKGRKNSVMTDKWRLVDNKELYDMTTDPGQAKNVAAAHPEVVKSLNAHYDQWWESVSERHGEYCPLVIGAENQGPSVITAHDWHGQQVPWNQRHVRSGAAGNGYWSIKVEREGHFSVALRRWPLEVDKPIRDAHDGQAINVQLASLKIQNFNRVQTV
ncbi:MAG: sulfatase-like hydrolase/transferase, partial [Verrucomicrobiota bacterium]